MNGVTLILMGFVAAGGWVSYRLWQLPLITEDAGPLCYRADADTYSMPVEITDGGLRSPRGVDFPPLPDNWTLDDFMHTIAEVDAL